jgi:hypothetical protein
VLDVIGPSGIAGQLARMPDVVARLLAEHVPDRKGRCRGCGFPGTGTPHVPAPCALWLVAEAASRIGRLDPAGPPADGGGPRTPSRPAPHRRKIAGPVRSMQAGQP